MNTFYEFLFLIAILLVVLNNGLSASAVSTANFNKDFYVTFSPDHAKTSPDGKNRTLTLDKKSGSGFASNKKFLFGQFDMQIKLIRENSAGTVVTFYLNSTMKNHDELDFEFLGNVPKKSYTLQTNVFVNGSGNREQRIKLWFDPTVDFHTYSILWNIYQIVFLVDGKPIRTFRNHIDKGVPFPNGQPMNVVNSIWDGSEWATNGGKDKIHWANAPFAASFENPKMDACIIRNMKNDPQFCWDASKNNWWNQEKSSSLTLAQRRLFKWVRNNYFIYDYCKDNQRFENSLPKECSLSMY